MWNGVSTEQQNFIIDTTKLTSDNQFETHITANQQFINYAIRNGDMRIIEKPRLLRNTRTVAEEFHTTGGAVEIVRMPWWEAN